MTEQPAPAPTKGLISLPRELLVALPSYLRNIEDFTNLASTCRALRDCLAAATPGQILRLAAAQSTTFFRPSPDFLAAAVARGVGKWARRSAANEAELAVALQRGARGLLDLAIAKSGGGKEGGYRECGLTMDDVRELHRLRFDAINPAADVVDRCVGRQWYSTPDFWDGGVSDAYTISSEPGLTVFHLATYGELFGPDLDVFLDDEGDGDDDPSSTAGRRRMLSVETRLEFIKYCVPDVACGDLGVPGRYPDMDPRRCVQKEVGPYAPPRPPGAGVDDDDDDVRPLGYRNHNIALTWTLRSSRWRPHWRAMRAVATASDGGGEEEPHDFQADFDDGWWYRPSSHENQDWRQRLWENVMVCQGLRGLGMMRPGALRDSWAPRVKEWRDKIARMEGGEPEVVMVGRQATHKYPYLLGDLRVCVSGYVAGS